MRSTGRFVQKLVFPFLAASVALPAIAQDDLSPADSQVPAPTMAPESNAPSEETAPTAESPTPDTPAPTPPPPGEETQRERKLHAIEEGRKVDPKMYATQPEGKVLPQGLMRIRFPFQVAQGTYGYDNNGDKKDVGATLRASGTGTVIEYGLTNKISLQLLVPYILTNELGLDADAFRNTDAYRTNYAALRDLAAGKIAATPGAPCNSLDSCRAYIDAGNSLNAGGDTVITLPNGATATIPAGAPLNQAIDSAIMSAAQPKSGATGLGDIQLGGLYEFTEPEDTLHFSLGAGIRFPTGELDVPAAQRGTSRGVTELGLRSNLDYDVMYGLSVAWQHQLEHPITKAKKAQTSPSNPEELDNTLPKQDFERVGTRSVGFVRLKSGFGLISPALDPYGFHVGWEYDYNNAVRLDGTEAAARGESHWASVGLSADLVPYRVPLRLDYEHLSPINGKNVALIPNIDVFTVKAFYLF